MMVPCTDIWYWKDLMRLHRDLIGKKITICLRRGNKIMSDSSYAINEQIERQESIERTKKETQAPNAALLSLADRKQFFDTETVLGEHEKRLEAMRNALKDGLPPLYEATDKVGNVRMTEKTRASTEQYISVTSGYDIRSMRDELKSAWKYQRYFRKDSDDMARLRSDLDAVADEMNKEITFSSYDEIREHCKEMQTKYGKLILSCENYLKTHQSPHSIAGKARKGMAQRLIKAAVAEMDMLEDSAINCFDEAKLADSKITALTVKWDDILHHGRIKVDQDADHTSESMADYIRNSYELRDKKSDKHDVFTVIRDVGQINESHHIVAMSKLAEAMGLAELGGGGSMHTRMSSMIYHGKPVFGCVTTSLKYNESGHALVENGWHKRPGRDVLTPPETLKSAEFVKGELALPFLDYLCGITERELKKTECEKTETDRGIVLGAMHASSHLPAKHGFEADFSEFAPPEGTVISHELALKIQSLQEEDVLIMTATLLDEKERENLKKRLKSLKKWVSDHDEAADTAYNRKVREETTPKEKKEEVTTEKLTPLKELAGKIKEPVGKNKDKLASYLSAVDDIVEEFDDSLADKIPLTAGWDTVKKAIDEQYSDMHGMIDSLEEYIKQSKDDNDFVNRVAVRRLILAIQYQEAAYREHAEKMTNWAQSLIADHTDRTFDISFKQVYRESSLIAQRTKNDISFPVEEAQTAKQRKATRDADDSKEKSEAIALEKKYARRIGQKSLHELTEKLDDMIDSRSSNSGEIQDYGKELARVVAKKDEPIYGPKAAVEYAKAKRSADAERSYLVSAVTDRLTEYSRLVNELTEARDAYVLKQDGLLTGGVIRGSGRMKLMDEAYHTCVWEHDAFVDQKNPKFVDSSKIMEFVKDLMESGRPLEEITLTDLTNMMLLEKIEIPADLAQVSKDINGLLGKKKKFGMKADDSFEFEVVAKGLSALTSAKDIVEMEPAEMRDFYGKVCRACEAYLEKNKGGRKTKRKALVEAALDICNRERQGMKS